MGYLEVCHCGHNKVTHFEEKHTCLGMLCDCKRYIDRDDPKPSAIKAAAPVHPIDWGDVWDDDGPITLPMIPIPVSHSKGCMCPLCAAGP